MAASRYTFTKSVNVPRLDQEIRESAIVIALDFISTVVDEIDIWFKDTLSSEDEALLETLIENHVPTPLPYNVPSPVYTTEVVRTSAGSPNNEHSMQPWGAVKGSLTANEQGFPITLSDKDESGFVFSYNADFQGGVPPRIGDYIFQDNFCNRSWITAVDPALHKITLDNERIKPTLANGVSHYAKGKWISCDIPDWYTPAYLWGLSFLAIHSNSHDGKNDFIEFSIVDANDLFKDEEFCQAVFGCSVAEAAVIVAAMGFEENGEYGHWTKYYDESWVRNVSGNTIMAPDGAPGEILPHLEARISYFTSKQDATLTEIFIDYFPTAKP